jgi:branched-chain amino acid transport system substrate-binding protein
MNKNRWIVGTLTGILLSLALYGGGIANAEIGVTDNEIRVGSTMDLSGPLAFMGKSWVDGATLYYNYLNDQGGVHGRKIKLLVEDDGFQPPRTVQAAKKLVTKDKIFCMSMNMGAASIFAILPFLESQKVTMLPAGTANAALTDPPRKYVFLVDTSYITQAVVAVKWMRDTLKVEEPIPAVIYQEDVTGEQWLQGAKKGFAKIYGIQDVIALPYKRGTIDFSSHVSKCKQAGVTHIFLHANVREPAAIIKEAQRIQYKALYIGDSAIASEKTIELAGDVINASNGLYMVTYAVDLNEPNPAVDLFRAQVKKYQRGSMTNPMTMWGFNASWVLSEVLKRAGKDLTREGFIKAAETLTNFDTQLMTPVTWRPDKRGGGDSARMFQADPVKINWKRISEWIWE